MPTSPKEPHRNVSEPVPASIHAPAPSAPSAGPRPIRVVHVIDDFGTGGMERGVMKLIRDASPGFEHHLVVQRQARELTAELPSTVEVVSMNKPEGNSVRYLRRLSKQLKEFEPDVVHTRNWVGIDGVIAGRMAGIKGLVHGEHGWNVHDPQGKNKKRRFVRRFVSRWIQEFTCVSQDIARWLRDDVRVKAPVTQIYNGVNSDRFAPGPDTAGMRRELGIDDDAFLITFVGRLDAIKDIPTLMAAHQAVRREVPGAILLLVGYGFDEEKLRAMAGDGVVMPGKRSEVPEILRMSDVFALTSRNEGISNAILEGMASGLPAVVSSVGGNPELVEDGATGRLFTAGDADALAEIFLGYARDADLRRAHGAAARERVLERFSMRSMIEGYEAVYRRVGGES